MISPWNIARLLMLVLIGVPAISLWTIQAAMSLPYGNTWVALAYQIPAVLIGVGTHLSDEEWT